MRSACICAIAVALATVMNTSPLLGKTKKVSCDYIYHVPENMSSDEAKDIALTRAKAQAIADEFGILVTQTSTVTIDTQDDYSHTDFLSIGGSELKGEWIEDIEQPKFEFITDGENLAIKVRVHGNIREIEGSKVPFSVKILKNGTTDADETDRFISGDDLFLSFNSPLAGYLAVYLIDADNNAFCLIPYQAQSEGIFKAKANKRYLFFNPEYAEEVSHDIVDELILDTSREQERNRILTIFSPNKFYKGADEKIAADCPRSMPYSDFQKWLSGVKKKDKDLTVSEKAILIKNKS